MQCSILQLNRLAIILEDAEDQDLVRVLDTPTHRIDGTVFATVAGKSHIIDRQGRELNPADYLFGEPTRAAA